MGFVRQVFQAALFLAMTYGVAKGQEDFHGIGRLDDSSLYCIPAAVPDPDPLMDVAEEIRRQIDPTMDAQWPEYRSDYVNHILAGHSEYALFWERIPASSRRYVDLNNNGRNEYIVFSEGMNTDAWGFHDFFAVLGKPMHAVDAPWKILYLLVLPDLYQDFSTFPSRWLEFVLSIGDVDRDGRPDILFTTTRVGASASSRTLHVISMHADMKLRYHSLNSREPIMLLEPDALRPVFVQHHDDHWVHGDVGASVRARGYRRAYFRWNVASGFNRL